MGIQLPVREHGTVDCDALYCAFATRAFAQQEGGCGLRNCYPLEHVCSCWPYNSLELIAILARFWVRDAWHVCALPVSAPPGQKRANMKH